MRRTQRGTFLVGLMVCCALGACSDDSALPVRCAEDTQLVNGQCQPKPEVLCGEGTIFVNGVCVAQDMGSVQVVDMREVGDMTMVPDLGPKVWTCEALKYQDGQRCDCGCGIVDPDCQDPLLVVSGCRSPGAYCLEDATCSDGISTQWRCDYQFWKDGAECDCNCGALDPDCANDSLPVVGCLPGGTCSTQGRCENP